MTVKPAVSLAQIAREAGVSKPVVSTILNRSRTGASASEATRQRVTEIAHRLGYRPNAGAQAISKGRFNNVGLIMAMREHVSFLPPELLKGIHDGLSESGVSLGVHMLPSTLPDEDRELPRILRQNMVDGVLLNYTHDVPSRLIETVERFSIPAVWINNKTQAVGVHIDDEGGGYDATVHLIEHGHRRIVFADYTHGDPALPNEHYSVGDRRTGYARAMQSAGLTPRFVCGDQLSPTASAAISRSFLESSDRPTAVLSYASNHALSVMMVAASMGLSIPGDLSLMCFVDRVADGSGVGLSGMLLPEAELGRVSSQALIKCIGGRPTSNQSVAMSLISGLTVATPKPNDR